MTADLIQAKSDTHLWAKSFDREFGDILTLQSEIARAVADQIAASLTPDEKTRLTASHPVDAKAYEAYLLGRFLLDEGSEESLHKARDQFTKAVQIQKDYAAAYAGLASYYAVLPFYSALSPAEVFPKARAAAEKSLALDDGLAEAHASLAYIRAYYEWDWTRRRARVPAGSRTSSELRGRALLLQPVSRGGTDAWTKPWPRSAALRTWIPLVPPRSRRIKPCSHISAATTTRP